MSVNPREALTRHRLPTESPLTRTVPFDYVITVPYRAGESTQSLVNISTVGPYVVTGIGYSLLTNEREAPARFGSIDPDDVEAVRNPPPPQVASPPPPPIVVEAAASTERKSKRTAKSTRADDTPEQFRLFGAPAARLVVTVNGQALAGGPITLDERGRGLVSLPVSQTLAEVFVNDVDNQRTGPGLVLTPAADGTTTLAVTPQFGPLEPQTGALLLDAVATPGVELELSIRREGGARTRRTLKATVPVKDDKTTGAEVGRVRFDLRGRRAPRKDGPPDGLRAGEVLVLRDLANNLSATYQVPGNPLDFSLRTLPVEFLRRGFRVDPSILEKYLDNEVLPPPEDARAPFVPCGSAPGELSFLYSILDNGTGRALQNEPIHNIAGLGIDNGDRPFRSFPRPFALDPRSVLLFQVQALAGGPGTLYFVLHGYKVVGASPLRVPGAE